MPSIPVRQPDGKIAVWSTIVDDFTWRDLTDEEWVQVVINDAAYWAEKRARDKLRAGETPPHGIAPMDGEQLRKWRQARRERGGGG